MTGLIVVLCLILLLGLVVLQQDARQRRVDRQISTAMLHEQAEAPAPQTLQRRRSRNSTLLRVMLNYRSDAPQWPIQYTIMTALAVAVVVVVICRLLLMPVWVMAFSAITDALLVVRWLLGWQRDRYADKMMRQLPDAIEIMISAIKAGLPVAEAFRTVSNEMAAPTKDQFATVVSEIGLGHAAEDAVRAIQQRTGVTEYAMLSVTIAVQSRSGGHLAETLQILADTVRERVNLAGQAKALSAEAKLSARVLACIPFVAGFLLYLERPDHFKPLFADARGHMMVALGGTLLVLGIVTMRQMIKKGTTV